ncbi:2-hydroxyacid dehydrogenase [Bordetella sp. 02P26C-1]|uniref:2-hydroxyacid dehydrogenase n=1 Tax=Bordetella sp. 02P26C-1 TaxID=2683195 RepID=UPI001355D384|nr:2-hydroxyacid dehydrogenase [Bordetella sp. 02P26C-1]MVW78761.1 2-hydroxyacid dehydrogenase [Bordetella sp. 02P26C-1]
MTHTAATDPIDVLMVGPMPAIITEHVERHYRLHRWWEIKDQANFLKTQGRTVRGIVTSGRHGATRQLMESLPNLEVISSQGVGYDSIDIDAARTREVAVANTPGVLNACVADTALALLLNVSRRYCEADRFVRAGRWAKEAFPLTTKPSGKRCGIVGLGNIGLDVAKRAEAFDMSVAYYNRRARNDVPAHYRYYDNLIALAQDSDFLVVVVPGGAQTRHLINDAVLDALGPRGYLINVARGTVVDEAALVKALQDGRIAGAGLDVFEEEPQVPQALMEMDQVVLLPHLASGTEETRQAMADLVINNLDSWFQRGEVITRVV